MLGQNTLANLVSFEPHTEAPMHVHVEEQVVIVVDGEFEFTIDGETRTMRRGDVAVIPPWVPHGAITEGLALRRDGRVQPAAHHAAARRRAGPSAPVQPRRTRR